MNAWLRDTIERVVSTFAEVFLGVLLATNATDWDVSTAKAAAFAGIAAALAVVKAAIASKRDGTVSPASLVKPAS